MTTYTKETIITKAQAFCAKVGITEAKQYTQEAHTALLCGVICETIAPSATPVEKLALLTLLGLHGIGGNHSQFKQRMYPKATTAAVVAESDLLARYQL